VVCDAPPLRSTPVSMDGIEARGRYTMLLRTHPTTNASPRCEVDISLRVLQSGSTKRALGRSPVPVVPGAVRRVCCWCVVCRASGGAALPTRGRNWVPNRA